MNAFKLNFETINLDRMTPFRIAHGVSSQRQNVIAFLEDGVGEGAGVPY